MIYFVRGSLFAILENKIIIDNNGMGYEINVSNNTISKLPAINSEILIYTYLQVREDNTSLFGFLTREEKSMFNMLISVSGIGPKSAVNMLSEASPQDLMLAIITDDIKTMSKFPGIGKKTAGRLILELKDKIKTADAVSAENSDMADIGISNGDSKSDAVAALISLGYSRSEAFKVVLSVWEEDLTAEDLIKLSLKAFSNK